MTEVEAKRIAEERRDAWESTCRQVFLVRLTADLRAFYEDICFDEDGNPIGDGAGKIAEIAREEVDAWEKEQR